MSFRDITNEEAAWMFRVFFFIIFLMIFVVPGNTKPVCFANPLSRSILVSVSHQYAWFDNGDLIVRYNVNDLDHVPCTDNEE